MFARILPLAAIFGSLHAAPDTNWPRFRGPNGSGQVAAVTKLPEEWSEEASAWSVELPGEGNSSPVAWGERAFVTSSLGRGEQRVLMCFDINTGKELWRRRAAPATSCMRGRVRGMPMQHALRGRRWATASKRATLSDSDQVGRVRLLFPTHMQPT